MKKVKKYTLLISLIFIIGIIYVFSNPVTVQASAGGLLNNISSGANKLISTGSNKLNSMNINIDLSWIADIAGVVYFIACAIIIALTLYKAFKYGIDSHSTSGAASTAEAKKQLGIWIIICVIVIGAYPLFKLIVSAIDGSLMTSNVVNQLGNVAQGVGSAALNGPLGIILGTIIRVIQVGAIGYIIIRFTCDGIRYFTVASADGKAKIKSGDLQRDLILAVIIFGVSGFFEIIYQALN